MLAFLYLTYSVYATDDIIKTSSSALANLKLMVGDQYGDLMLDNKITRCEFVTLVNRMMGYDDEDIQTSSPIPFIDIDSNHWAYNNVKAAIKHELIKGYPDNTLRPDGYVTFLEAQAVLVRALRYESTIKEDWPFGVINKSSELKLNRNIKLDNDVQISRGQASVLVYNALTTNFADK